MVKAWMKNLAKLDLKLRKRVEFVIWKIIIWDFELLDIKKLEWNKDLFRCRVWNIRIVYYKSNDVYIIKNLDFRWRIYKSH
jgi:hypothetical protein